MCTHGRTSMGSCNGKLTRAVVPCVAACGGLHMSVRHPCASRTPPPTRAADARRRRVSHRAPALRPHRTDQISMRVQRAHNREGKFSDLFEPPKSGWGGWPPPGSAVLQLVVVWQGKKAVAKKKAAEEAVQVRSSPH